MVFTVAPTLRTDVVKPVDDFRRKDLFDFRSFTATRVEVTRGTDTLVLEKTKGADGKDAWKNGAGKTLDATKVDDALTKLSSLRAQSFEAGTHASLKTPAVVVTAAFDKRTETASIGRAGADAFAVRTGEPGQARVDTAALDDALKALDALK
jgi:hypothetical protein